VQPYIGGNKAMAWVEEIISSLSLTFQVERAKELEDFTKRLGYLFKPGEPLDVTTRGRMEAFFGYDLGKVRIYHGQTVEEASRRLGARAFTYKGHIFGPHQNLDNQTPEGLALLAHELTHVIQQTQPHRLPQGQVANPDTVPAAPLRSRSNTEMVLLAPPKSPPLTSNPQPGEAQAQASEQLMEAALTDNKAKSIPQINPKEVANKVYRFMQHDLILERERATKIGG